MAITTEKTDPPPQWQPSQLVTLADLQSFKEELRRELLLGITAILQEKSPPTPKKWLKTAEVRKLLGICPATLQGLRDNGTIPHTRLGNNFYYDPEDIQRELEKRKSIGRNRSGQFIRPT